MESPVRRRVDQMRHGGRARHVSLRKEPLNPASRPFIAALAAAFICLWAPAAWADSHEPDEANCKGSVDKLLETYDKDPAFRDLLTKAFANVQLLPPEYGYENPWFGKDVYDLADFFREWCVFLPTIQGSSDTGLDYIMVFEAGRYQSDAIQVRLGNQIGLFDTKSDKPDK